MADWAIGIFAVLSFILGIFELEKGWVFVAFLIAVQTTLYILDYGLNDETMLKLKKTEGRVNGTFLSIYLSGSCFWALFDCFIYLAGWHVPDVV